MTYKLVLNTLRQLAIACLLGLAGLPCVLAQTGCPTDRMIPALPIDFGTATYPINGYPFYTFYRVDGVASTSFATGETIYYYASHIGNPVGTGPRRYVVPSQLKTYAAILPPQATTLCTMTNDPNSLAFSSPSSFTERGCSIFSGTQYVFGTIQRFSFDTPGSYTIAFANSTETRTITVSDDIPSGARTPFQLTAASSYWNPAKAAVTLRASPTAIRKGNLTAWEPFITINGVRTSAFIISSSALRP